MAIGDNTDMFGRLKSLLPAGWFGDSTPVRDALLWGYANALAWGYTLYLYAKSQTRIKSATDGWLDIIGLDFFGNNLIRYANQTDASYKNRILINIFRERTTRHGMEQVLYDLTGRWPVIIEPARPKDVGSYGAAVSVSRASTATFFDLNGLLVTADVNVARYDTDPVTGLGRLLIEGAATNFQLRSQDFSNSGWLKTGANITSDTTVDPSGGIAAKLAEDSTLGVHRVRGTVTGVAAPGKIVVSSIFAKAAERQFLQIGFGSGGTGIGGGYVNFDLSSGVFAANSGASGLMINVGHGWFRCVCTFTVTGDGSTAQVYYSATDSIAASRLPSHQGITGNGLYIYGAQSENDTLTSYILVASATITRAADILLNNMPTGSIAIGGYGVAGAYGSVLLPYQAFITAFRPFGQGLPFVAGYGISTGAYSTPSRSSYGQMSGGDVTDADIYAAIDATKPIGTVAWTRISS